MPLFVVVVDKNETTLKFVDDFEARLSKVDLVQNPFKGSLKRFWRWKELMVVVDLTPIYPPVWLASVFFLAAWILFSRWWLLLPGVALLLLGILWTPVFYIVFMRLGLRRAGYRGRIKHLTPRQAWRVLLGSDRSV